MTTLNNQVAQVKLRYADCKNATVMEETYIQQHYMNDISILFDKIKDLEKRLKHMNELAQERLGRIADLEKDDA